MKLKAIDNRETSWFREWVYNFDRMDRQDHSSGLGKQIPTAGIADNAITESKMVFKSYDSGEITSTGTTSFAHGFGGIPLIIQLQYKESDGNIVIFGDGSHISNITSTTINIDFTGLTIDASNTLRICALYMP